MPTYEYRCEACGHVFEEFQMMSDEPLNECPQCGGSVKRLIGGGIGVIFKGSGFYVTDNKSANSAAPATPAKKDESPKKPSAESSKSSA